MANDINMLVIVGRLTHDALIRYTSSGKAQLKLSLAVNRTSMSGETAVEKVSYFDAHYWGDDAEELYPHLTKGARVGVQGDLRQDRWEHDGSRRSKIYVNADRIELMQDPFVPTRQDSTQDSQGAFGRRPIRQHSEFSRQSYETPKQEAPQKQEPTLFSMQPF